MYVEQEFLAKGLLKPNTQVSEIGPDLWSCLPESQRPADYDRIAAGYDILIGNPLYHRIAWGTWPSCHSRAVLAAVDKAKAEFGFDCGCGSLLFTASTYSSVDSDRIVFLDRSLGMLRRARRRLPEGCFLQGNALDLPFRNEAFSLTMCWGTLHVLGSSSSLLRELHRVTAPGGLVAISTLVRSDRVIGERMLTMLHKQGEIAKPETEDQVRAAFSAHFLIENGARSGNFLFLTGRCR